MEKKRKKKKEKVKEKKKQEKLRTQEGRCKWDTSTIYSVLALKLTSSAVVNNLSSH